MDMKQFIRQLQASRKLSMNDLALLLGYKSATSVARIVQDKANAESVTRFGQLLKDSEDIALTDEEASQLDSILEKKKLGSDEYAAADIIRRLLREDSPLVDPVLVDSGTGEKQTLLERYLPMQGLRIMVLNCEAVDLFAALARLTSRGIARVEHYLYSDQSLIRTVMAVRAVLPLLHDDAYFGAMASCSREELVKSPRGILLGDVMVCEYEKDGTPWFDLIVFQREGWGMLFSFPGKSHHVYHMVESIVKRAVPIRNPGLGKFGTDYAAYIRYWTDLERDRAVYRIKPDPGMEQVPLHAWLRAFRDGPAAGESALAAQMGDLAEIFRQRQWNAQTKKQAQHHVFKQRAMWKFVRTGRLSDQFWAFDSLTVKERLETLQNMLEQHTNNPFYQVHFLKDEDAIRNDEIVCYEGTGVSLIKAGTDYNLTGRHSETMLTQPEFVKIFRSVFLHSILQYHVQPEYKTRKILLEMIEYCQTHMDE